MWLLVYDRPPRNDNPTKVITRSRFSMFFQLRSVVMVIPVPIAKMGVTGQRRREIAKKIENVANVVNRAVRVIQPFGVRNTRSNSPGTPRARSSPKGLGNTERTVENCSLSFIARLFAISLYVVNSKAFRRMFFRLCDL